MDKFKLNLKNSKKLLKFISSSQSTTVIRDELLRHLFIFCDRVIRVDFFLASLFGERVLEEDPIELRELYEEPGLQVMHALHAARTRDALVQVVLALERSGNGEIIASMLEHAKNIMKDQAAEVSDKTESAAAAAPDPSHNQPSEECSQSLSPHHSHAVDVACCTVTGSTDTKDPLESAGSESEDSDCQIVDEVSPMKLGSPSSPATLTSTAKERPTHIYMATYEGVKAYCLATSQVTVVSTAVANGIAYDQREKKVYMCRDYTINRANIDGSNLETFFVSKAHGFFYGLSIDSSTGYLYALTDRGALVMFRTADKRSTATVLNGNFVQSYSNPALHLNSRAIYFTSWRPSRIWRGQMDGTKLQPICSSTEDPRCITVDTDNSKIYWVEMSADAIKSSDLDGRNAQILLKLPPGSKPYGIVYTAGRIYWGTVASHTLQSCDTFGQNLRAHLTETAQIRQIILVSKD